MGYAWLVPQETLSYALLKNDYGYIENGHIADLCTLAVVTTDNMRSESNHGDTSGYAPFSPSQGWEGRLWAPMVSTWYARNPEHLWILNWLGAGKRPTLVHVLRGALCWRRMERRWIGARRLRSRGTGRPPRYIRDEIAGQSAGVGARVRSG